MFMSRLPCVTASTRSGSSLRKRPLLTNTHVSWSPTARWTSVAATAESTPPDSAQITRPEPTCARMLSTASARKQPAVHDGSHLHTRKRKSRRTSRPLGVDLPAQVMCEELHAVTDAQHREPCTERFGVNRRRSGFVDTGGAATE